MTDAVLGKVIRFAMCLQFHVSRISIDFQHFLDRSLTLFSVLAHTAINENINIIP